MPSFPPLLKGHRARGDAFAQAVKGAANGRYTAGDCVWRGHADALEITLVMEPDVPRARCPEMAPLAMVAFADAAGALMPPEVAVTYRWPDAIDLNGARVGGVRFGLPDAGTDWLATGLWVRLRPPVAAEEPGRDLETTSVWDEGAGDVGGDALLESIARHWVNWLHRWDEDGFAPVAEAWLGRRDEKDRLAGREGRFVGLDDVGNAIVARGETHVSLDLGEALA